MNAPAPELSIIIPALNEEKHLPKLLDCLANQSFTGYEVIVADAGSDDNTRKIAEEWGALVVDGGLPGPGRNKGAEEASGNYYLFLDADVQIEKDFLEKSMSEIARRNIEIAGCEAVPLSDLAVDRIIHKIAFLMMITTRNSNPRLPGYCIYIKSAVFRKIGGFDEEVQLAEDYDLVRRAAEVTSLQLLFSVQVSVSMRRFDKEGRLNYIGKGIKVFFHRKLHGEIRDDTIEYEFDNFQDSENPELRKKLSKFEKKIDHIRNRIQTRIESSKRISRRIEKKINKYSVKIKKLFKPVDSD